MDSKAALKKIREEEEKTEGLIEKAKKDGLGILHSARLKKEEMIKEAQDRANKDTERLHSGILKKAQAEIDEIERKAKNEIEALRELSKKNFDKASEFLKSRLD